MKRIGIFVCHCGTNIAGTLDIERIVQEIARFPEVVYAVDYKYMCSDPGQKLIREHVAEDRLDAVIVAACSPAMHETTFRRTAESAGVNPYQTEIANIREQASWVHQKQQEAATNKAIEAIRTIVAKVHYNQSLTPYYLPLVKRALVIGGGIAGLQAALDVADAGYPVVLVEKADHLGGRMAELSGLYLNMDGAHDHLRQKIEAVVNHPNIQVLTRAEVAEAGGYVGNFVVKVEQREEGQALSEGVGQALSEGVGQALSEGVGEVLSEGVGEVPSGSPVPYTFDIGAIVVATGYDLYDKGRLGEYGGGRYPDVIDGLQLEEMLRPDGPTGGQIRRPSDGQVPGEIAWIQCAGSRDPELHMPYCSKVCCMYVAKQTIAYKQQVPDGQATVFYIDIRSQGKGYEEFVQRAMEEHDVLYVRGKASKIWQEGGADDAGPGQVVVWGVDTLTGLPVEVQADLVVLATATVPRAGAQELGQRLHVSTDEHGFFSEAHPKLRPVESLTAGVYLAGAAQFPKDIPETVAQASGAASKVLSLFSQRQMVQEPTIAYVDPELCSGCGLCIPACPYEARTMHDWQHIAVVNTALCQGCAACTMVCPNKACQVRNLTHQQILSMMEAYL
ncbi:MAG: CoB--CoM heterodisulfide reductase iron-sulfur subunit A family protein [Anaerolineaceae bacterium]|nr:CoB--CoM heterodisulfide reductase iron-sulfur subunit A family protein [Anaerolineaceae bacterium]